MKLSFWEQMLIYDADIAAKTIVIVKKLLHEGKLIQTRIDKSFARIVKCKERLGKCQEGYMVMLACEHNRPYARST